MPFPGRHIPGLITEPLLFVLNRSNRNLQNVLPAQPHLEAFAHAGTCPCVNPPHLFTSVPKTSTSTFPLFCTQHAGLGVTSEPPHPRAENTAGEESHDQNSKHYMGEAGPGRAWVPQVLCQSSGLVSICAGVRCDPVAPSNPGTW